MILQSLTEYYQRKLATDSTDIAPPGFEQKEIPFILIITQDGSFVQLEDTRHQEGKKKIGSKYLVPQSKGRSGAKSYEISNDLWDHYGYVLGVAKEIDGINKKTENQITDEQRKNEELAQKQHQSFIRRVNEIAQALPQDIGIQAVKKFLANPSEIANVLAQKEWSECSKIKGCNLSFRLAGCNELVCQSKLIQQWIKQSQNQNDTDSDEKGVCLITGEKTKIARLHQAIKGVNAKPSPFSSVNLSAFESYGKKQGMVFPVSEQAMFEYTTALNTLLASRNCFRIGDVTAVCWGEKITPLETILPIMCSSDKDNPDQHIECVKTLFKSIHNGQYTEDNGSNRFYVLGLSPNSARIVVRLWQISTVAEMSENLAQWFEDIRMVRTENSPYPEYMPMMRLLCNLVLDGKADNIPSDLISNTIKSALNNQTLPISVLQAALRRNKAEQKITHGRACLIKAYLNRKIRINSPKNKELTVDLDTERTDIGYLLGRLFATLEKIQGEANQNLNSTISDRYFGAASTTPIVVFPTLVRLSKHHLSKIRTANPGRCVNLEKILQEIIQHMKSYPHHLDLNQQSFFSIGYYHQKQALYTKPTTTQATESQNEE